MFKTFNEAINLVKNNSNKTICVAVAEDLDVLKVIKKAEELFSIKSILVGNEKKIKDLLKEINLKNVVEIVDETDEEKASLKASFLVCEAKADMLMKGHVNSSIFLKAVLNENYGLRKNKLLSHLAIIEVADIKRLFFITDGGMNVLPSLKDKEEILQNTLEFMAKIGFKKPKVAVLSHNEKVNLKLPSTYEAKQLVELLNSNSAFSCVIEGPMALDVAASSAAAISKNIKSKIAGEVDVWLMPNIEAGNIFAKSLVYYANGNFAGLILGAKSPIILSSRADTLESKLASITLACLAIN